MRGVHTPWLRAALLGAAISLSGPLAQAQDPGMVLVDPRQLVQLEHADRVTRIRRETERLGVVPAPEFHEEVVPADRLPRSFAVDVPVLRVVFSERSFFDTAQWTLRPEAAPIIAAMARAMRGDARDAAVFVAGHTDSRGSEPYNYDLSVNRADAVAKALYAEGVGEVSLWRVGFGEAVPLFPNDTPEHMSFNRRVEFLFAARTEPVLDVLKRQLDRVCVAPDEASTQRCKTSIELRSSFEAVRLTSRRIPVALDSARREVAAGGAKGKAGLSTDQQSVGLAADDRIAIDLRSQRYSIPMARH